MNLEKELQKAQELLGKEKNYPQTTFYEGYIKGLRYGQEAITADRKELVERVKKLALSNQNNGAYLQATEDFLSILKTK